ncbi:uncharacterized protein LOC134839242 isoform X2 [Symsagittifera roscoffensis]|uniref:uncharacterized protein LOC134839242 isoform X2 n=1 Tax=Symsagittifera roscoffensis TaxID=84072 RepID=UPI00307BCCC7
MGVFNYCDPDEALISLDQSERASGCPLTVPMKQTRLMNCLRNQCPCAKEGSITPAACQSGRLEQELDVFEVLRVKKCSSKRLPPFDYYRTANWLTLVLIYFKNDIATYQQLKTMESILQTMNVSNMVAELLMDSDSQDSPSSTNNNNNNSCHKNIPRNQNTPNDRLPNGFGSNEDLTKISFCLPRVTRL